MSETVAAVVVTYNRKTLLVKCLRALLAQTRQVDKIIIVDNASRDGTYVSLVSEGILNIKNVEYVSLAENLGGAGGFDVGARKGYGEGYDWLWLMDDDGQPGEDCLFNLLTAFGPDVLFRSALVLDIDEPDKLAFRLKVHGVADVAYRREADAIAASGRVLPDVATPFNGILVHRRVLKEIGFPKKELFMWGDETEYLLRARKARIPIATSVDSLFLHPRDRMVANVVRIGNMSFTVVDVEDRLRSYLAVRNGAYIKLRYRGIRGLLRHVVKYTLFYFLKRGPIAAAKVLWYCGEGAFGKLSRHTSYLSD